MSSVIGAATARLFAGRGWNAVGTVRRPANAEPWQDRPNVRILAVDVTDPEAVAGLAEKASAQFGRIDVVVNKAGCFQTGSLETSTMDQIHETIPSLSVVK